MEQKSVEKMSDKRPPGPNPSEGGRPSPQTNAAIGALSKGSDSASHKTRANQTTSTGSPKTPVSEDFLEKLGEMHDAEKQLTRALPILEIAAGSEDLKKLLGIHLKETRNHVTTLEEIAESLGTNLPEKRCQPIRDMITEAEIALAKTLVSAAERDPTIIAAGRKVEQFEIAAYTPLCQSAKEHEWTHELALLTSILNQEKLADELLAGVGQGKEPLDKLVEKASLARASAGTS
jgi:ferritin-like metal-binding protein YciE